MSNCCNSKNILTIGTFLFSIAASSTVLCIAAYKIIVNDNNKELWTGMLTFLVGLYIPSPISSFVKFTNTGHAVVQQNIQTHQEDEPV